ncbi:hypothetical protein SVA_3014 [Sulfurifustis variabilis]|uniref:Uncharacterized protein n=1 Tax=Sulfurifustis variabilis TaxID=1675686 RepID=A0A1B4VA48_9GAMM|nr:type IV toxin-antitoxin system AbiEi family antitoxin [Sulfurifustis variabilis]BAU49562.1 hypothetical protein SVA_3014 [Sulfurifustis variabilis]
MNERAQTPPLKGAAAAILRDALKAFEAVTAMPAAAVKVHVRLPEGVADAVLKLPDGKTLIVEVKRTLTPATLGQAAAQLARFKKPGVLVAPYVTPPMAERLKALDVPFMDTAGNAYIRLPNLLIFVTGRKLQALTPREKRLRALRPTGLKVLFALLCRPDLIDAPYRDIARAAGVALGTVGWVFDDLRRLGHIRETKAHGRVLEDREGLIDKWVEAYARELRPKLKPRRFRVANADWWKTEDLAELDMWLGGEPAAGILTKHLRPEVITIYGDTHFATLARRTQPAKDEHGNLELLQKFWHFDLPRTDKRYPLAPPLLIYADLVATADARNIETAQIIRERFLAKA